MSYELYYVTSNPAKFAEVADYITHYEPSIILKQFCADIDEIQTYDQQAIALDKAKKAWELLQKPLLVDDAAVYFERYTKFPGTMSKFIAQGLGFEGLKRLIDQKDPAYFLLYMVYVSAQGQEHVFQGRCQGRLVKQDSFEGDIHLPYDCLFLPDGAEVTYAQLRKDFDAFALYNYRIKALQNFLQWYKMRAL